MIVYAVLRVQSCDFFQFRTLVALRSSRNGADEVISHQSSLLDYEVEEWEVPE